MKSLSYLSIVIAIMCLLAALAEKFGLASLTTVVSPIGFMKATAVALLFGINFALLELVDKK